MPDPHASRPHVVVVDDTNAGKENAESFADAGCTAIRRTAGGFWKKSPHFDKKVKDLPRSALLILGHQSCWDWVLDTKKAGIEATLTLWYTAYGHPESITPPQGADGGIRSRPLGKNPLSVEEAKDLVAYALDVQRGRKPTPPSIMHPPPSMPESSVALAILCQGFLVFQAVTRPEIAANQDALVGVALKRMGWYDASEAIRALVKLPTGAEERRDPSSRTWWLEPFLGEIEKLEEVSETALSKLREDLQGERTTWSKSSEKISTLEKWLIDGAEDLSPEMVAEAYIELADGLRAEP